MYTTAKMFNSSFDIQQQRVQTWSYEELNSLLLYTLHSKSTKEFNSLYDQVIPPCYCQLHMCITVSMRTEYQSTSGPVNAHLIPGLLGIGKRVYMFMYKTPWQGQNVPYVHMCKMLKSKEITILTLCLLIASFDV